VRNQLSRRSWLPGRSPGQGVQRPACRALRRSAPTARSVLARTSSARVRPSTVGLRHLEQVPVSARSGTPPLHLAESLELSVG